MILIVLPDIAEERDLLREASRPDADAQRQIYEQYFPPIYNFIRLRVDDREQAQDIAADVFLDFFVAIQKRRAPQISLRAWLFRVARNKIYDFYGRKKTLTAEALEEWLPEAPEENPESQFMNTMQAERAQRALRMLVDEQQEVLLLRFGQGLSLQETADLMNKSIGAVKSLQFRAVERLRQILDTEAE